MFALSANMQDNVVPLPESSEDIALLLTLLSGDAGDAETFKSDLDESLRLHKIIKKYDILGGSRQWATVLLARYIKENPFECFAVAFETEPADLWLAKRSIEAIRLLGDFSVMETPPIVAHLTDSMAEQAPRWTATCYHANPSYFSPEYIMRLGLRGFAAYVGAWIGAPCAFREGGEQTDIEAKEAVTRMVYRFGACWDEWDASST